MQARDKLKVTLEGETAAARGQAASECTGREGKREPERGPQNLEPHSASPGASSRLGFYTVGKGRGNEDQYVSESLQGLGAWE